MSATLRVLFVNEGVLGHRTMIEQLRSRLAGNPAVEANFVTVPPPNRLERLLLRRWRRLGDGDLFELRWRLRWSWRARQLLRRHRRSTDVAVIVTQAAALLAGGTMRRPPYVPIVDTTVGQFMALEYDRPADVWTGRQLKLLRRLERRALRGAAAIVALTKWNADAVRREYADIEIPIETIHPGLDRDWWEQAATARTVEDGAPLRVLFVGNDIERKGLPTLIEAVEAMNGAAVLDVVSAEPVKGRAAVHVHSGVSSGSGRLRELYAAADVLALPTRADAVPWVVLEAMAAGLPVVASDVGAVGEMLGNCGELIAPGDPALLAAALHRLDDPQRRAQLGAAARDRVRERFDSGKQTQLLLELLSEAAGRGIGGSGGTGRLRRRTVLAAGVGLAGVAVATPYATLIPDNEFEQLVASALGIESELAAHLLEAARAEYGDVEYEAHAAAFALAVRDPAATILPASLRARAIDGLLEPMLSTPAATLAYGVTGVDPAGPACAGLVRYS